MGKKTKKKTKSGHKEKRITSASPRTVTQQSNASNEAIEDKASGAKERRVCAHIDKGIDMDKLSSKLQVSASVRCEDCREGAEQGRVSKSKGKHGKKKGGGLGDSKSECIAIWICLGCGHFSCGGVGFPTTPQSHAVRHARQSCHPLAIQFENPQLRWCFPCNTLIPFEKSEENDDQKDVLHDIVKMAKQRPSEDSSRDAKDIWFGSGSVTSATKSEYSVSSISDGSGGYVVSGLINLGNTCFFNSVMQNLLAIDKIRDYFLKMDEFVGPLTEALKKLFIETLSEDRVRNVINPKSLFSCVCAKVPQFRGFQQHDSHELLRCLLDGLCNEELNARKRSESAKIDGTASNSYSIFVDAVFGGQLSSTVTCLVCGHSSVVYEPFLDLSLPVPTKTPPPRKSQAASRVKKPKLPPKRNAKVRPKVNRDANHIQPQTLACHSTSGISACELESPKTVMNFFLASSDDTNAFASRDMSLVDESNNSATQNHSTTEEVEKVQSLEKSTENDFTWMDYCAFDMVSDHNDMDSNTSDISRYQDSGNLNASENDVLLQNNCSYYSKEITSSYMEQTSSSGGVASQIDERLVAKKSEIDKAVQGSDVLSNNSESISQLCCKEPITSVDFSVKPLEEETPLLVQDSEVLLLPYKEETSTDVITQRAGGEGPTSSLSHEQEPLEFDGFGDLFNEPEVDVENSFSSNNASEAKDVVEAGFVGENSSGSDQDVVDDTNSPVSVDSCLAYFTKAELLSKTEHAWQCENCSKLLQERRMRSKKHNKQTISEVVIKELEERNTISLLDSGKYCTIPAKFGNLSNGNTKRDIFDMSDGQSTQHNGEYNAELESDQSPTTTISQNNELYSLDSKLEDGRNEMGDSISYQLQASRSYQTTKKASDFCTVDEDGGGGCSNDKVQMGEAQLIAKDCHSADLENEDVDYEYKDQDSEGVKLERDAAKQILLTRAPLILTIHLKRFSQDARGRLSKLNGHVDFRDTMDLKPYRDPRHMEQDMLKYRLIGVVEHLGSMRQGHYVAYVRGSAKSCGNTGQESGDYIWYYASDGHVRQASLKEVLGCEAYILFYEKM